MEEDTPKAPNCSWGRKALHRVQCGLSGVLPCAWWHKWLPPCGGCPQPCVKKWWEHEHCYVLLISSVDDGHWYCWQWLIYLTGGMWYQLLCGYTREMRSDGITKWTASQPMLSNRSYCSANFPCCSCCCCCGLLASLGPIPPLMSKLWLVLLILFFLRCCSCCFLVAISLIMSIVIVPALILSLILLHLILKLVVGCLLLFVSLKPPAFCFASFGILLRTSSWAPSGRVSSRQGSCVVATSQATPLAILQRFHTDPSAQRCLRCLRYLEMFDHDL